MNGVPLKKGAKFKRNKKSKMSDGINARRFQNYVDAASDVTNVDSDDSPSRTSRAVDLYAAASGYGGYCPEGIPVELALCLLLGGFALAFGILYRAVTKITGGRRRKKRFLTVRSVLEEYQERLADFLWWGRSALLSVELKLWSDPKLRTSHSAATFSNYLTQKKLTDSPN